MLDTNICIYLIKRRPPSVLERFQTIEPGQLSLSSITVAELVYGARKSAAIEKNLLALEQFLLPFNLLSFDEQAAQVYGLVRAQLERKGQPIGSLDYLIAAYAIGAGHILVTNNESEFRRIDGLQIENWVSE